MSVKAAFIVPHPPLIIPEIGQGEERKIQNTVDNYDEIGKMIAEIAPETIIFITPHSTSYADYIHISPGERAKGDFWEFGAEAIAFETDYDTELVKEIEEIAKMSDFYTGTLGEKSAALDHATMVPMHFINKYYQGYKSVRVSISGLSYAEHYRMGRILTLAVNNLKRSVVVIASGDLSHKLSHEGNYGFDPAGPQFDEKVCDIIKTADFGEFLELDEDFCQSAGECGLRSFIIMSGMFDGKAVNTKLLSYEGPFGVGYAVGTVEPTGDDKDRYFEDVYLKKLAEKIGGIRSAESEYVALARHSLESYICDGKVIAPGIFILSDELTKEKAGVFVSIKKRGQLRGCIGTIFPMCENIAEEIIINAISSGTKDHRFEPVEEQELNELVYSVDVLGEPESISDKSQLDPKNYGVIVSFEDKRGLLLPDLQGIDTVDQQVSIALQKGGISPRDSYSLERFKVVRYR